MMLNFRKLGLLFLMVFLVIFFYTKTMPFSYDLSPKTPGPRHVCPVWTAVHSITPLNNTYHYLVSAFVDQRVKGFDIRIISIFKRDAVKPLHCVFCCAGEIVHTASLKILEHSDHFGFPFSTTDVMCSIPKSCNASHVTLQTQPQQSGGVDQIWLPIRNQKSRAKQEMQFNFTVCVSSLFGDYNNVLQFTQTLEMYRLLGVNRVVIYNTSCGRDLDRLLKSYSQTSFLEVVPWPIDLYLTPSKGWLFSQSGGDLHYFGQLATLNDCMYRYMDRSQYVLLNDIDEIIMPYEHDNLMSLMAKLHEMNPKAGVFYIENHIFPKKHSDPSGRFRLPQWSGLPGVNILDHIYKEEPDRKIYHPHKLIVQPRFVEQLSVHEVLKGSRPIYKVPPAVCRIIHTRQGLRGLKLEQLVEDKRLWDFHEKLIPNVDKELRRAGLLQPERIR